MKERIGRARAALSRQLQAWDVKNTVHVGFEIILPALLRLLREKGHDFEFDGRAELDRLNRIKLSKFRPVPVLRQDHRAALFRGVCGHDRL